MASKVCSLVKGFFALLHTIFIAPFRWLGKHCFTKDSGDFNPKGSTTNKTYRFVLNTLSEENADDLQPTIEESLGLVKVNGIEQRDKISYHVYDAKEVYYPPDKYYLENPQYSIEQPQILSYDWGKLALSLEGREIKVGEKNIGGRADVIVGPGYIQEWPWKVDDYQVDTSAKNNGKKVHDPGITKNCIDNAIKEAKAQLSTHKSREITHFVISKGVDEQLELTDEAREYVEELKENGIQVFHLRTYNKNNKDDPDTAYNKYNELCKDPTNSVVALFHTTC